MNNETHRSVNTIYGAGSTHLCATTGKAACALGGVTLHNAKEGLFLPVKGQFRGLKGRTLRRLQERWKNVKLLVIDEFTMLRQKELYYIDQRLRQIMGNHHPFGGIAVILLGDPGQLPPVGGRSLWDESKKGFTTENSDGFSLYQSFFTNVVILDSVQRVDRDISQEKIDQFLAILSRLRDAENTLDDFHLVAKTCCQSMTRQSGMTGSCQIPPM